MAIRAVKIRTILVRVLLFAAVGAAATVLVAWTVALRPLPRGLFADDSFSETAWLVEVPEHWPERPRDCFIVRSWVATHTDQWTGAMGAFGDRRPRGWDAFGLRSGWPLRALAGSCLFESRPTESLVRSNGILWLGQPTDLTKGAVPLGPLWPGFAVDTAFWGGAAFVVWSVPGFVRRRVRGRCVRCGYELAGVAVCPECGDISKRA